MKVLFSLSQILDCQSTPLRKLTPLKSCIVEKRAGTQICWHVTGVATYLLANHWPHQFKCAQDKAVACALHHEHKSLLWFSSDPITQYRLHVCSWLGQGKRSDFSIFRALHMFSVLFNAAFRWETALKPITSRKRNIWELNYTQDSIALWPLELRNENQLSDYWPLHLLWKQKMKTKVI